MSSDSMFLVIRADGLKSDSSGPVFVQALWEVRNEWRFADR